MSFRDEMNASLKTPQQVAQEKEDAEVAYAKMCVQNDYESIKRELKAKASNGQYLDCGNSKVIETEIFSRFLSENCNRSCRKVEQRCGFLGRDIKVIHVLSASLNGGKIMDVYFKELDKLVKEEGITYSVIGKYEDVISRQVYPFSIPGGVNIERFSVYAKDIQVRLKVRMKL